MINLRNAKYGEFRMDAMYRYREENGESCEE